MLRLNKQIKNFFGNTFSEKFFLFVYFYFIIRLHLKKGLQYQTFDFENIIVLIISAISIVIFIRLFDFIFQKSRFLTALFKVLSICGYMLISYYHMRSRIALDYAVIIDNLGLALYKESFEVILGTFKRKDLIITGAIGFILICLEFKYKKLTKAPNSYKRPKVFFLSLLVYSVILFFVPYSYDEFLSFTQSKVNYYFPSKRFDFSEKIKVKYPYVRTVDYNKLYPEIKKPHIFLIMVESFNSNFVNSENEKGEEYTPYFNSLIKDGMYFDNFWGVSVQTARGQLVLLCSLLPITKKKVFTHYPDLKLNCLPEILKKNGFDTLFFKAFSNIKFDNTGYFVKRNGFDHVSAMTGSIKDKFLKEKSKGWGWGIQDDQFYKIFFNYLDDVEEKNVKKGISKKYFAALTTVSNHQKFDKVPVEQRYLYPKQSGIRQGYANSIRVTDEYLKTFFEELEKRDYLKNSIVIITGDHSFPMGEHYSYAAENGFYKENFITPFLILWKNNSKMKGINKSSVSQLDVAPTVMHLLGISGKTHFLGSSMFSIDRDIFVPLIQPYGGSFLGSVRYPFKYIFHQKTKKEYLFNLQTDSVEQKNLIDSFYKTKLYLDFQQDLSRIFINDFLIKNNRVFK